MKSECREFLQDYVTRHCYGDPEKYDFYALFKQYSAYEIKCKDDIKTAIDEFFAFLTDYNKFIFKSGISNPPKLIRYSSKSLHSLFDKPMTVGQRVFAEIVKTIAPCKQQTSILEVGAGMYPKTSIYLAESLNSVAALDKLFILSSASMKAMNVTAYQQYFDVNTQIKDYDFIVGRKPCSAIESMVKSCVKENKPYFIELCNCSLPKKEGKEKNSSDWLDVLKQYDTNVQYLDEGYVYNIDITKNQLKRMMIIYSSEEKKARKQEKKISQYDLLLEDTFRLF